MRPVVPVHNTSSRSNHGVRPACDGVKAYAYLTGAIPADACFEDATSHIALMGLDGEGGDFDIATKLTIIRENMLNGKERQNSFHKGSDQDAERMMKESAAFLLQQPEQQQA